LCLSCQGPITARQELQLCIPCFRVAGLHRLLDAARESRNGPAGRSASRPAGGALLYFNRGTVCQSLIHALKYDHRPEIGHQLGRLLGEKLRGADGYQDLTGIVPVPIHARRRHQRGYNQAEKIAAGIAEVLPLPVYADALKRQHFAGSQTKKDRMARLENVRASFQADREIFPTSTCCWSTTY
jgi:predicted amidophosphoribosyltransferase